MEPRTGNYPDWLIAAPPAGSLYALAVDHGMPCKGGRRKRPTDKTDGNSGDPGDGLALVQTANLPAVRYYWLSILIRPNS